MSLLLTYGLAEPPLLLVDGQGK